MKFFTVFVFAFICLAAFIGQSQAGDKGSHNNIVLKDGHLILSSQGKKGKLNDVFLLLKFLF